MILPCAILIILVSHALLRRFETALWVSTIANIAIIFSYLFFDWYVRFPGIGFLAHGRIFVGCLLMSFGFGALAFVASGVIGYPFLAYRKKRQLLGRFPAGHCQDCGYDLTGNVSGVCPECGVRI